MLLRGSNTSGWIAGTDVANIQANTTTFKAGGGTIEYDKTGGTQTAAQIVRRLPVPFDFNELEKRGATLTWWAHHTNWTNVTTVQFFLIFESDTGGASTDYAGSTISSPSAGWNKSGPTKLSALTFTGSPTVAQKSRCVAIILSITMADAAHTISDVKFGPAVITIAGTGSGGEAAVIELGADRLLLPPVDEWTRNPVLNFKTNHAEAATEIVLVSAYEQFQAVIRNCRSRANLEGLRRWAYYAMANNDWGFAYDSRQLVSTTVDAASGAGESSPWRLNIADTTEVSFLFDDLGLSEVYLLVGPNSSLQYEIGRIQATGFVSAGSHVLFDAPLRYTYASGDLVRSACSFTESNYYPTCALTSGNPVRASGDAYTLDLKAREA